MRKKLMLCAVVVFVTALVGHSYCRAEVIVSLRYDDYSAFSNVDLEIKHIEILNKYQVPGTFGVIPNASINTQNMDNKQFVPFESGDVRVDALIDAVQSGLIEVGLHGFTHQTCDPVVFSEFFGLPYEIQRERIVLGKKTLEELLGTTVITFIPPYNVYDGNTVAACRSAGIEIFSASAEAPYAREYSGMIFLHSMTGLKGLDRVIESATSLGLSEPIFIMVLYHSYDFAESGSNISLTDLSEFEALMERCRNIPDVKFMNMRQIAEAYPGQIRDRYIALLHYMKNRDLLSAVPVFGSGLSSRTLGKYNQSVYWTVPIYRNLSGKLFRKLIVVYAFVASTALLLSLLYCHVIHALGISRALLVLPIILCAAVLVFIILTNISAAPHGSGVGILDRLALIFFVTSEITLLLWLLLKKKRKAAHGAVQM